MTESLRIAVADDERDMRDYFARILPRMGHRVVVSAADGEELVQGCRAARPDLVITDIKMPRLDGIEAAAALGRESGVPVILVSAHHDPERARAEGADNVVGFLVKPVRQADLGPAIALAMRKRNAECRMQNAE
jgi:response regulator NasT